MQSLIALSSICLLLVCSFNGLLLAKILNFGKYVRLSVCLSVIDEIQAAPFEQSTPNLIQIWNLFAG